MAGDSPELVLYPRALEIADATLASYPADRWDEPTPCEQWRAVHVAGHMIWAQHLLGRMANGGGFPHVLPDVVELRALATDDPYAAWLRVRDSALKVLTGDVLSKPVTAPIGEMPLGMMADGMGTLEMVVHSWDLSVAAGAPMELDPELVGALLGVLAGRDDTLRGPNLFGPPREVPPGATDQQRLLALLGRGGEP